MAADELILGRFTAGLLAAESFEARFSLLEKLADKLNFEGLTYTFFPLFGLGVFEKVPPVVMQTDAVSSRPCTVVLSTLPEKRHWPPLRNCPQNQ